MLALFFTITLRLASRGIIVGIVLAFARAVGEFGATIMVAGNIPGRTTTLPPEIFKSVQLGHDASVYRLLIVSVIIAFGAVWLSEALMKRSALR